MLFDKQNLFSENQNLAQVAAPYLSSKNVDLEGVAVVAFNTTALGNTIGNDVGKSPGVSLLVQIVETFTSGGAATLKVDVITDNDSAMGSPTVIMSTPAYALAALKAGKQFPLFIPPGIAEKYIGLQYTIGTATTTAGKVTAGIVGRGGIQTAPGTST